MKKTRYALTLAFIVGILLAGTFQAFAASSIVVALDVPPRMMNPHGDDSDASLQYMANFFDGLLQRQGSEGKLMLALATRFERLDLNSWKFYLRKGVKFHNGNPFTAEDVKFSFERLGNPEMSEFLNTGKSIASIDIIDTYTVVIRTKDPIPWFANNMHQIFIMDKESTEARDSGDVMVKPIGTGAYKLKEIERMGQGLLRPDGRQRKLLGGGTAHQKCRSPAHQGGVHAVCRPGFRAGRSHIRGAGGIV